VALGTELAGGVGSGCAVASRLGGVLERWFAGLQPTTA
jgi:hypothetical protein